MDNFNVLNEDDLITIDGGVSSSLLATGIVLGIGAVTVAATPVAAVVLGVTAVGLTVCSFCIND